MGAEGAPLSQMAQGQAAAGHHLLAHTGSPGGETEAGNGSRSLRRLGQPVTSPVTVDPGSEGVLAPEEAGAWRSGPADRAERRASRNDRQGPSRPRLSPFALGRGGWAGWNGELLRAPRLSPSPVHSLASYGDIAGPGRTHHSAQTGLQGAARSLCPPPQGDPGPPSPRTAGLAACIGAPLRPRPPSSTSKPPAGPRVPASPAPSAAPAAL